MCIHFFCLCPLSLAIELNFNISKVAYSKAVSKKFKHAFWLMMKNKEMRKENVLL